MKNLLIELGITPYEKAWLIQKKLHRLRVRDKIGDSLILLEHMPVITIGRSGTEKNLLVSSEELKKRGISVYRVERGGDITYHGPGQLVGYIVIKLKSPKGSLKRLIYCIEDALIKTLKEFGIEGYHNDKMRGVWVGSRKIAAIGVAVEEMVTYHGFALNVNTNLNDFKLIIPCGLREYPVTSMEVELGRKVSIKEVQESIKKSFESEFGFNFEKIEGDELHDLLEETPLDKEQVTSG